MGTEVEEIIARFENTRPIFKGSISNDSMRIDLEPTNKYVPSKEGVKDPLELLAIKNFSEYLSRETFTFKTDEYLPKIVHRHMVNFIIGVYLKISPLRSPRMSNIYRWLDRRLDTANHPSSEGLIALYRYIHKTAVINEGSFIRFDGVLQNPHAKNVLAILEKMRKYHEN